MKTTLDIKVFPDLSGVEDNDLHKLLPFEELGTRPWNTKYYERVPITAMRTRYN